jgi:hypothetical protein
MITPKVKPILLLEIDEYEYFICSLWQTLSKKALVKQSDTTVKIDSKSLTLICEVQDNFKKLTLHWYLNYAGAATEILFVEINESQDQLSSVCYYGINSVCNVFPQLVEKHREFINTKLLGLKELTLRLLTVHFSYYLRTPLVIIDNESVSPLTTWAIDLQSILVRKYKPKHAHKLKITERFSFTNTHNQLVKIHVIIPKCENSEYLFHIKITIKKDNHIMFISKCGKCVYQNNTQQFSTTYEELYITCNSWFNHILSS